MFILKKLNREKTVETAAQAAELEEKGWQTIKKVEKKLEVNMDGIAEQISEKMTEQLKNQLKIQTETLNTEAEPEQPEGDNEPGAEAEQEPEEDNEPDTEVEPEKKTSTRSRKKG